jgi:flagellar basal-body rod protein FlgB
MFEQIHARSEFLHQALDGLVAREKATAQNLANADTPGYKAQQVEFENLLRQKIRSQSGESLELSQTHAGHLSTQFPDDRPFTVHQLQGIMRNDQNGVDLEQEMTTMAQTQMKYTALSDKMAGGFSQLKFVISEGGR